MLIRQDQFDVLPTSLAHPVIQTPEMIADGDVRSRIVHAFGPCWTFARRLTIHFRVLEGLGLLVLKEGRCTSLECRTRRHSSMSLDSRRGLAFLLGHQKMVEEFDWQ